MNTKTSPSEIRAKTKADYARPQSSPLLASHLIYVSEEEFDFDIFVEHGGWLVEREGALLTVEDAASLRQKIASLPAQHSHLAAQLAFLAAFIGGGASTAPETVRNEALFALLYAAKEEDLIPDALPISAIPTTRRWSRSCSRDTRNFSRVIVPTAGLIGRR